MFSRESNRFVIDNHDARIAFLNGLRELTQEEAVLLQVYHESLHQIFSAYTTNFNDFSSNLIGLPNVSLFMRSEIITRSMESQKYFSKLFNELAVSTWFTIYENRHYLISDGHPKFILDTVGPSYLVLYEVNE